MPIRLTTTGVALISSGPGTPVVRLGTTAGVVIAILGIGAGGAAPGGGVGPSSPKLILPLPNAYDDCLLCHRKVMANLDWSMTQFRCICRDSGPDPWDEQAMQGTELRQQGSIVMPAVPGDNLIFSYRVPTGYDLVIESIHQIYTGTGFVQGSGDILWRIKFNRRWLTNMGTLAFQLGTVELDFPLSDRVIALSQTTIQYVVNAVNASGMLVPGSRIIAGFQGWLYPRSKNMPLIWKSMRNRPATRDRRNLKW